MEKKAVFLNSWDARRSKIMTKPKVRKIAILRANALGDFIFVLPAISALKKAFPESEITYLGLAWHNKFIPGRIGSVDRVIVVPPTAGVGEKEDYPNNQDQQNNFFAKMKREQFDIAIQLHGGGRYSNPFIRNLGAKITVGLKTPDAIPLDISIPYIYYQNEIFRYMEVISVLGIKAYEFKAEIKVTEKDRREAIKQASSDKKFVILHPGATDIKRRWLPLYFAKVGDELSDMGYKVMVTGVEKERKIAGEVISEMRNGALNLCGKLSMGGLSGLISLSSLMVANDTGPLHLAYVLGTPTVGIYWCGNMINGTPPLREKWRAIPSWTTTCPLCGEDFAKNFPYRNNYGRCKHETSFVSSVTPEEVIFHVKDLLN